MAASSGALVTGAPSLPFVCLRGGTFCKGAPTLGPLAGISRLLEGDSVDRNAAGFYTATDISHVQGTDSKVGLGQEAKGGVRAALFSQLGRGAEAPESGSLATPPRGSGHRRERGFPGPGKTLRLEKPLLYHHLLVQPSSPKLQKFASGINEGGDWGEWVVHTVCRRAVSASRCGPQAAHGTFTW